MAKKKKDRVVAVMDGLKLKEFISKTFGLSADQWFALYATMKRNGVLLDVYTETKESTRPWYPISEKGPT